MPKELDSLQNWIARRKKQDPSWDISDSTAHFIVGLEGDLAELSKKIGVDLCIMTIRHVDD